MEKGKQDIQSWLVGRLAKQLNVEAEVIDVHMPFSRYALSSIDSVSLVGELEDRLERRFSVTLFWDYPTIEELATYLSKA